jgi:hypothetical protein
VIVRKAATNGSMHVIKKRKDENRTLSWVGVLPSLIGLFATCEGHERANSGHQARAVGRYRRT